MGGRSVRRCQGWTDSGQRQSGLSRSGIRACPASRRVQGSGDSRSVQVQQLSSHGSGALARSGPQPQAGHQRTPTRAAPPDRVRRRAGLRLPSLQRVTALGRKSRSERLSALKLDFDAAVDIQFTSGTTGLPKGVTLTHHNLLNNGLHVGVVTGIGPEDRVCLPVPLYHCFGMVMGVLACLTQGATMVFPSEGFEPLRVLQAIAAERCTHLYGVPTMFIAILGEDTFADFDLRSLRGGIMAGAPCPVEVMKAVMRDMNMAEVTIAYGMTETSPVSFQTRISDPID